VEQLSRQRPLPRTGEGGREPERLAKARDRVRVHSNPEESREEPNMTREELLQRISIDPQICFGKPCIRGTRIWVALIIENLATGVAESEILQAYPDLQADDIRAALAYAAEVTRERVIPVSVTAR
jgi:uncharacterized protein (DUF433 family)